MDTAEALDLTKENILPLSEGRITSQFGAALHAQTNTGIQHERRKIAENYELNLRTYEGDDPLSAWYDYILWIEQSYPKGGKEGNLQVILEKCLTKFKDVPEYAQDTRHVRLWIKYIDVMVDVSAVELYAMVHSHGVGTQSALFYRKWAAQYEKCQDFKNVDKIFQLGFDHNAEPKEELARAYNAFLQSFTRMSLYGTMPSPPRADPGGERQVLNPLRPHGPKNQAPNVRVGRSVLHGGDSRRTLVQSNTQIPQSTVKIFTDENCSSVNVAIPADRLRVMPRATALNKENSLLAGTWTNPAGRKARAPAVAAHPAAARPAFQIHTDEAGSTSTPTEPAHNVVLNALKTIKKDSDFSCQMAIFEPPDPTKRPMYAKHKVYAGGQEFSFEELRAAKVLKMEAQKKAQLLLELQSGEIKRVTQEPNGNRILFRSTDDLKLVSSPKPNISTSVTEELEGPERNASQCHPIEQQKIPFAIFGDLGPADSVIPSSDRRTLLAAESQLPDPPSTVLSSLLQGHHKTFSAPYLDGQQQQQHCSPALKHQRGRDLQLSSCNESYGCSSNEPSMQHSQSITVNTKEAMSVMNELWGSSDNKGRLWQEVCVKPVDNQRITRVNESDTENQLCLQQNIKSFEVFTDNGEPDGAPAALHEKPVQQLSTAVPAFEIFTEDEGATKPKPNESLNFVIYEEQEEVSGAPLMIPLVPSPGMTEAQVRSLAGTEAKENHAPLYYELPDDPREMAGILQPSFNIPFQPFQDEEEAEQDNDMCDARTTSYVTQNFTQAFKFPLYSSTPFHGKPATITDDDDRLECPSEDPRLPEVTAAPHPTSPFTQGPGNLSVIMENSKELNYKSSSSSGSSCGGATTRKSTFFSSQWSTRGGGGADSFAPESTSNRTDFRTGRDSLAPIRELAREERSSCSGGDEDSGSSKQRLDVHLDVVPPPTSIGHKSAMFAMDEFDDSPLPLARDLVGSHLQGVVKPAGGLFASDEWDISRPVASALSLAAFGENQFDSPRAAAQLLLEPPCNGTELVAESYDKTTVHQHCEDLFTFKDIDSPFTKSCEKSLQFHRVETTNVTVEATNYSLSTYNNLSAGLLKGSIVKNNSFNCSSVHSAIHSELQEECALALDHGKKTDHTELDVPEDDDYNLCDNQLQEDLDPFDVTLISNLLTRLNFPGKLSNDLYCRVPHTMPKRFKPGTGLRLDTSAHAGGTDQWIMLELLGKGSYAKVIKAECKSTNAVNAVKVQEPGWVWELYISCEIHRRLGGSDLRPAFMKIEKCLEYDNGTMMFSEYLEHGTLLNAANKLHGLYKQSGPMAVLTLVWAAEMLQIVEYLHACRIVHGDLKPDNFLVRRLPSSSPGAGRTPTLQLVDFGRSIDMDLFPPGTRFTRVVTTKDFQCVEMQTGRPWTYQTDLYGLASCVHCLMFGEYMKVVCVNGKWRIKKKLLRYSQPELWEHFFDELLNVESCDALPDLTAIRQEIEKYISKIGRSFLSCFNNLAIQL